MSLYYEYKSCCSSKKKDEKKEERHEQDCFCGKYLKNFLGQDVTIYTKDGNFVEGRIVCIDKETGIVTVAGVEATDELVVDYICCKFIVRVRPE